jgi:hypothetical protein
MHPLPHGNDQAAITLTSLEKHVSLENARRTPVWGDAMTQIQVGSPDLANADLPGNERVHSVLQPVVSRPKPDGTDELRPGIRKSASTTQTTRTIYPPLDQQTSPAGTLPRSAAFLLP